MDPALAKAATVHTAATVASEQGWARSADAARLATTSVETLTKKLERGVPFEQARSETAAAMNQRFDDRGRERVAIAARTRGWLYNPLTAFCVPTVTWVRVGEKEEGKTGGIVDKIPTKNIWLY